MHNKYCNRLVMNKTSGNAIRLKLRNLQPALKNLQIKVSGNVRNGSNQVILEMNNLSLQMQLHSFCLFVFLC